jgi:hypothetical protein
MAILVAATACYGPVPGPSLSPSSGSPSGPQLGQATRLEIGQHFEGTVVTRDPVCYPQWDASGRCRLFAITAATAGILTVTMSVPNRFDDMDFFIATGSQPTRTDLESDNRWRARVEARTGQQWDFWVMSYDPPRDFELDSQFQVSAASLPGRKHPPQLLERGLPPVLAKLERFRVLHTPAALLAVQSD